MKTFFDRITGREAKQHRAEISALNKDLNYKTALVDDYQRQLAKANTSINTLREAERILRDNEAEYKHQIKTRDAEIAQLKKNLENSAQEVRHAETVVDKANKNITNLTNELNRRVDQFNDLVKDNSRHLSKISEQESRIQFLSDQLSAKNAEPTRTTKIKALKAKA